MIDLLGPIALAGLIFVKEVGIPIPIPGDLLILGAGVAASRGDVAPVPTILAVVVASVLGGIVQFAIVRGRGRSVFFRLLERIGIPADRIERQATRLRGGGARAVAAARVTPGLRIVAIAASGLAALPFSSFLLGLAVGNAVFMSAHFALGLAVGEPAIALVAGATGQLAILGIVLAGLGAVGWWVLGRLRPRPWGGVRAAAGSASLGDWADATCPACLTLALLAPSPVVAGESAVSRSGPS